MRWARRQPGWRASRWVPVAAAFALLAVACTSGDTDDASELPWWNERVFYEVFVRSFKDADGDGIGDLRGLTESLDYLNDGDPATTDDLGVTGLWLMPVFAAASYHGYDVTDYRTIEPDYGTLEDFEALVAAAHERGIAVLLDLVLNHTSSEHPWFQQSRSPSSPYRDWYQWRAEAPGWSAPWGGPVWHELDGQYYYGLFWRGMPDLDVRNPEVTAELVDIARYWLSLGVDGFRLDAARHLVEEGPVQEDTVRTREWLADFTAAVHETDPDALVLGEVWSDTAIVSRYVPESLDLAFNFDLGAAATLAGRTGDSGPLREMQRELQVSFPPAQSAVFLTNHDQDRVMSVVDGNVEAARLAATLLLTQPAVPFVYYGEEVGLAGAKPDEQIRTPMPWAGDDGERVGFTTGTPWEAPDPGYPTANVADQDGDRGSLLSHYRRLIRFRDAHPSVRHGAWFGVESSSDAVHAYLLSEGDDHVLAVLNLGPEPAASLTLDLAAGPLTEVRAASALGGEAVTVPVVNGDGGFDGYQPIDPLPALAALVIVLS